MLNAFAIDYNLYNVMETRMEGNDFSGTIRAELEYSDLCCIIEIYCKHMTGGVMNYNKPRSVLDARHTCYFTGIPLSEIIVGDDGKYSKDYKNRENHHTLERNESNRSIMYQRYVTEFIENILDPSYFLIDFNALGTHIAQINQIDKQYLEENRRMQNLTF